MLIPIFSALVYAKNSEVSILLLIGPSKLSQVSILLSNASLQFEVSILLCNASLQFEVST